MLKFYVTLLGATIETDTHQSVPAHSLAYRLPSCLTLWLYSIQTRWPVTDHFASRLDDARIELSRMSVLADLTDPTKVAREIEILCGNVDTQYQMLMKGQGKLPVCSHACSIACTMKSLLL